MAKGKTSVFFCQECGYESAKWMGQCPACKEWNTFVEETVDKKSISSSGKVKKESKAVQVLPLSAVKSEKEERIVTGIAEFDRVLGGGIVRGSLVLVGGDPGIGKSTLLLQVCRELSQKKVPLLYVSGEESLHQIKMRADRLGDFTDSLELLCETSLDIAKDVIQRKKPEVVVIDSIQTMYNEEMASAPGSVSQVRETTGVLMQLAKTLGISVFIVGHVTKDGAVAGSRTLEHMVDTVLYFEGDRYESYRILRGVKNRFGSTNEILTGLKGLYEKHHGVIITDEGVKAAVNLSARYINDRFLPDKAIDLMDEAAARIRLKNLTSSDELLALKKEITDKQNQLENALSKGNLAAAGALMSEKEVLENKQQKLMRKNRRTGAKNQPVVGENEIADVVSGWTKIPVNKLTESEAGRLAKLEQILHKRVIGQEEAVSAVAKAVRRGRVGLKDPKKPIGSFLFLGPTGVGKTEVSKALAEAVFGKEDAMIRVDMSEYMEKHSVSKMIGSPPGYVGHEEGGQLSEKVRRNPFSVILFDEIEKAHPDVFNILLQVLDDGRITDSQGRTVDFKNTIIIMTSNAGASSIIEPKRLGFGAGEDEKQDHERMKNSVMEEVRRIFKPEFLNRIDETIVFRALNKDDMKHIVTLLVKELKKRCKEQLDIELTVRDSAKSFIVDKAYDRKYGARPLKRKLQEEIEDRMSEDIITGKIKRGNKVIISTKNKQISLTVE